MSEGLYLPSRLVDEMAAERAERMARADQAITFHDTTLRVGGLGGSDGQQIPHEQLLREIRGWVAIGLRPISDRLSSLDLRAHVTTESEEEDPELPTTHPANAILRDPNPIFTLADMLGLMGAWVKMTGVGYLQVLHDAAGVPRELWPMPPHRVFPVPSRENVIGGYIVQGQSGQEIPLETREVVRVWRPDPLVLYQGQGDLGPQSNVYNAELYRVSSLEEDFKHDSTPRMVFEPSAEAQALDPTEKEALRETWRELNHRRRGRGRGIPAFTPPGYRVHEIQRNADAAGTALLGDKAKEQLLAALGTPGSIAGMVVDVNRAAAETNRFVFDTNTILPIAMRIERSMTQQLARQFDPRIVYKFREFVEKDREFLLRQEQSDLDRKVVTVNEVRERRGRDSAEWGDLPIGSFTDTPYTGEPDLGLEQPSDLGGPPRLRAQPFVARANRVAREHFSADQSWKRVIQNERRFTRSFQRAMGAVFREQADTVIRRLREMHPEPRARVTSDDLFFVEEWDRLFRVEVSHLQERIFVENAREAFGVLEPGEEFTFSEVMQRRLGEMQGRMIRQVNTHSQALIARQLQEGTAQGESVDQLAKRISSVIVNRKRARTISRTEVGKAAQLGQLESFAQSTVVERKQWNTSRDAFVRDSHAAAEGQVVDLEGQFRLPSGVSAAHPLDPDLPARELVNCRCFLTPVFVDEEVPS